MLFLTETHRVAGLHQDNFEALWRDEWMPRIATDAGTRLLWYFNHAHGSSISFNVVTVTAVADFEAWERLARRVESGDLQETARRSDEMRYGSAGTVLQAAEWSPLREVDLGSVPTAAGERHALTMYIEDTITSEGPVDAGREAVKAACGSASGSGGLTELTAALQPVPGGGKRREFVLLQKILDLGVLAQFYLDGEPPAGAPWSATQSQTPFAGTWRTRVLRAAPWSPLW